MSKERLESLKRNREWTEATGEKFYTVDKKDYEWLIEQAERLEAIIKHRNDILKANEYLNEQNKRYREALEKIARINIDQGTVTVSEVHAVLTARKALEVVSDE